MSSPEQYRNDYVPGGKPLTGKKVLAILVAFFGVIFVVNLGFLLPNAVGTFRGLETDSAYRTSQEFNTTLAGAAEQQARGWNIEAFVERNADGSAYAEITTRDRDGAMLPDMEGAIVLARPADSNLDRPATLERIGYGVYEATFEDVPAGQWDLVLTFHEGDEQVFHSRNRVMLR
ncbi:MAG: FixH family protein [Salinarimonas sp.]|nr:FixH family protein [Salinarimonas sp.]